MADQTNFLQIFTKIIQKCNHIKEIQFSTEGASVDSIGDGNINDVIRVKSQDGSRSVVMKHAPPYLKLYGPGVFPLSVARNEVEFRALSQFDSIYPGSVPKPYCMDQDTNTMMMEDLVGYEVMRSELIAERVDKVSIPVVGRILGSVHRTTHISVLPDEEFQQLIKTYENKDMCKLTEEHIFTFPYQEGFKDNATSPDLQKAMRRLYDSPQLITAAANLKNIFLTKKECLIHGDMHTGSYMVKDGVPKLIDLEFAMVGPPAFDLGLLLASYMMSYHAHMLTEQDNDRHRRTSYKMLDAARTTVETYLEYQTASIGDREQYVKDFISEAAGFAAAALIRRVIRNVHTHDIRGVRGAGLEVLETGLRLLGAHHRIHDIHLLLNIALQLTF